VSPSNYFVVGNMMGEAAVEHADETVAQSTQRLVMALV
jgi:hypothetical protein